MPANSTDPRIKITKGDITGLAVDAIVNAANSSLMGGGGVDGAIHRAGGPEILKECALIRERRGGCRTGEAVITTAGRLKAKKVIHTVGPVWGGGRQGEDDLLANCYKNCLRLALANGLQTIAFPNIGTGVYGFPKDRGARIALKTVTEFLEKEERIKEVIFVCYDEENYRLYADLIESR